MKVFIPNEPGDGAGAPTTPENDHPKPLWERRGLRAEAALEAVLEQYSKDTPELRRKLKEAESKAAKFDEMQAEQERKAAASMTEAERLTKERDDWKARYDQLIGDLSKRDQALLFERTVASRLAGAPAKDQKPLRRLYETILVKGFADADELKGQLDAIDDEWLGDHPATDPNAPITPDLSRQPAVGSKVTGGSQAANMPGGTYDSRYLEDLDRRMGRGGNKPSKKA